MSNTKMLIDATHPEETRVVVQRNGRVEEFDFESAARKLLRGNIYLAKVTRVEPSLQAAFVDYGGNRHGFLAFNEVHPDYYQIPVADRQALLDEEAAAEAELEAAADRRAEAMARRNVRGHSDPETGRVAPDDDFGDLSPADASLGASHIVDVEEDEHIEEIGGEEEGEPTVKVVASAVRRSVEDVRTELPAEEAAEPSAPQETEAAATDSGDEPAISADDDDDDASDDESGPSDTEGDEEQPDHAFAEHRSSHDDFVGHQDALNDNGSAEHHDEGSQPEFRDSQRSRQRRRPRSYKIQEVIKRRQIILVQVVKEERGNKGAALTTYLSLAGRYTVLMPNTARGGGISRKITNPQDRRRLKSIAQELEVPEGMGLIIRTAGAARTKQEIKRDFEYLLRLWESVRDLTLQSTAPSLVYEEGDLIKRSIRDLYNKDVEEIVVAGDAGHQEAADFMKMLMPSHTKNVVAYREPTPLFTRYGVERQLNAMFQPQVTLRSGGYIVINQTEALVAIDVNSGKSTREFSIEETALATNLEAADEIARQLKLRDLAGLIVIDFIDMEEKRNNRAVERRLKDALRFDRARIQLGRISHFGLMEMSRQRLRTGVLEGSTSQCAHCQGTGIIRSTESVALAVLRGIEDTITAGANGPLIATTTPAVALYILNSKRAYIADMEVRHGYSVTVLGSDRVQGANFTVERSAASALPVRRTERAAVNMDWGFDAEGDAPSYAPSDIEVSSEAEDTEEDIIDREPRNGSRDGDENGQRRSRRRRRRGRGGRERGDDRGESYSLEQRDDDSERDQPAPDEGHPDSDEPGLDIDGLGEQPSIDDDSHADAAGANGSDDKPNKRRRRGRRGGRRGRERGRDADSAAASDTEQTDVDDEAADESAEPAEQNEPEDTGTPERAKAPSSGRRPRRVWDVPSAANGADDAAPEAKKQVAQSPAKPAPQSIAADVEVVAAEETPKPVAAAVAVPEAAPVAPAAPARRRHETGSSEPRIERVVVGPGEQSGEAEAAAAIPQRKGWWQRKFSSE
ncbi:MAG: Rne/Rng family ribonuclease [Hyphomicrobium sp.]|uniref:Rne/Rng family ribonuclease n=1 Tax=Hyphomicrobium sp. TaxID=82 RepID=UPI003568A293